MQNYTVKILHDVEDRCVSVVRLQDCILKLGGVEDGIVEMQCSIEVAKDGIVQKLIDIAVAQDRVVEKLIVVVQDIQIVEMKMQDAIHSSTVQVQCSIVVVWSGNAEMQDSMLVEQHC